MRHYKLTLIYRFTLMTNRSDKIKIRYNFFVNQIKKQKKKKQNNLLLIYIYILITITYGK